MSNDISLIQSKTVGVGGIASISFTDIPQSYTDLKLVMSARTDRSGNIADGYLIKPNNTTPTIRYLTGDGTTAYSGTNYSGIFPASTATASTFGNSVAYFTNYANTSYNKSFSVDDVSENNATGAYATLSENLYSSTSAITTIVVQSINSANIVEGSTFYLYGISNVTSTTKATGGIVSSDGTYNYHMFPYSGTFTPTQAISADILVIAGGGGTSQDSGGGGAGGLLTFTSQSLTAQAYTCTIGSGGVRASANGVDDASSGSNSQFGSLTASIGGARARYRSQNPVGGSGAGGNSNNGGGTTTPSNGTAGQGNAGGTAAFCTGGGGGAGGVGGNADGSVIGGTGGIGATSALLNSMAIATGTGQASGSNYYYAGGGGGWYGDPAGGLGGGGRGSAPNGLVNTGGGGAGYYGNGGSGLVIIRYAI